MFVLVRFVLSSCIVVGKFESRKQRTFSLRVGSLLRVQGNALAAEPASSLLNIQRLFETP